MGTEFLFLGIWNLDHNVGECSVRIGAGAECLWNRGVVEFAFGGTIAKLFFNGIIVTSDIQHVVDKKLEAEPLAEFVMSEKIGWFGLGLDKTLGVEPFREFNVPIFARVNKTVDSFVEELWRSKVFAYSGK